MKAYSNITCLVTFLLILLLLHSVIGNDLNHPVSTLDNSYLPDENSLGSFSLASAQLNARLSSISNCISVNRNSIINWTCDNCKATTIKLVNVVAGETASAKLGYYVGYSPNINEIIVVFRGSSNLENWIADFSFKLVGYPACGGCNVHEGFIYTYKEVRPAIISAVNGLLSRYPNAKVRVTGHSLGGAIAVHCALDFKAAIFAKYEIAGLTFYENLVNHTYNTPIPQEIKSLSTTHHSDSLSVRYNLVLPFYNFGAPRVGCPRFAQFFQSKIGAGNYFRLTHRHDIVPRLPLTSQGYAHFPTEVYFPNAGVNTHYKVCNGSNGEDPTCINAAKANEFEDHRYYAGIEMKHNGKQCS